MSTAEEVLQRCKDIVDGNYPKNGRVIECLAHGYNIVYLGFEMAVHQSSSVFWLKKAAFLLGMDSEPAPAEIVLKWEEGTDFAHCIFNEFIHAELTSSSLTMIKAVVCYKSGAELDRAYFEGDNRYSAAQQWCADTIKKLVTQSPKQ